MLFVLRPAVEADALALSRVSKRAFPHTSLNLFPPHLQTEENKDSETNWRIQRTVTRMRKGFPAVVAVKVDEATGQELAIVGYSQWEPPHDASVDSDIVTEGQNIPDGMDKDKAAELLKVLEEQEKRLLGDKAKDTWSAFLMSLS